MPTNTNIAGGQDWGAVNVGNSSIRKPIPKTAAGIAAAKRAGVMATQKVYGAGGNQSAHSSTTMSARKLEETDELRHSKVDKSLSKAIMQARTAKKLTQKQLATAINEKPQIVAEYENGKAIPNGAIIVKLERKLGCKLPRPGKKAGGGGGVKAASKTGVGARAGAGRGAGGGGVNRGGPAKRR